MKNCVVPSKVFYVRCSLDDSQDRMLQGGKGGDGYLPSSILSKKIRLFNEHAAKLLPFFKNQLAAGSFVEVDTGSQTFEKSFKELAATVEPTVLHIRSFADEPGNGEASDEMFKNIMYSLTETHGYAELNVNELISLENERRTALGKEFLELTAQGKIVPADVIIRLLRKVVYSGDGRSKFILSGGFPFTVQHAVEFESHVSQIAAVIYSALQSEDSFVHIASSQLSRFNIDTLFQKEFRLRVLTDWDDQNWQEIFDAVKIDWCLVMGAPLTGKTTLAATLRKALGGAGRVTLVDFKELEAQIKATMGTPEEPFEGKVPLIKVEEAIVAMIQKDKKAGKRLTYLFDSFPGQPNATEFARFVRERMKCPPDYIVTCQVDNS